MCIRLFFFHSITNTIQNGDGTKTLTLFFTVCIHFCFSHETNIYLVIVLQEWKERYGNPREDNVARNRSSHEMKETNYSDTVNPSTNRRKSRET